MKSHSFEIENITRENINDWLDEIVILDKEIFGANSWNADNFAYNLPGKFSNSYLVRKNNRIVGYLITYISRENVLHISRIGVSAKEQKNGIGKKLISFLIKNSIGKEIKTITLEFDVSLNVEDFYAKLGFISMAENDVKSYLRKKKKTKMQHLYIGNCISRKVMYINLL